MWRTQQSCFTILNVKSTNSEQVAVCWAIVSLGALISEVNAIWFWKNKNWRERRTCACATDKIKKKVILSLKKQAGFCLCNFYRILSAALKLFSQYMKHSLSKQRHRAVKNRVWAEKKHCYDWVLPDQVRTAYMQQSLIYLNTKKDS